MFKTPCRGFVPIPQWGLLSSRTPYLAPFKNPGFVPVDSTGCKATGQRWGRARRFFCRLGLPMTIRQMQT